LTIWRVATVRPVPSFRLPGARIGVYEIVAPIGAGGLGEVYRGLMTMIFGPSDLIRARIIFACSGVK
jgi:hypothetical protein